MTDPNRTAIWLAAAPLFATMACVVAMPPQTAFSAQPEPRRCEFRDTRELSGPAGGMLAVTSGAGPVEITGEAGLSEFRASAILCASEQELLDALAVSLEGDRLETRYPEWRQRLFGGNRYASISLAVRVPTGTAINLEDGSGSAAITDVGSVTVDDGSGSLRITGARGDVRVEDGSGGLRIEDVTGDVAVDDGSGGVRIDNVTGNVDAEDNSGELAIRGIGGDVVVDDGSGSLDVREVTGSVLVADDGSGGIEIRGVGGSVRIEDAGSGGVEVRDVEGNLYVRGVRRSRIDYDDIRGELDLPRDRNRRGRER